MTILGALQEIRPEEAVSAEVDCPNKSAVPLLTTKSSSHTANRLVAFAEMLRTDAERSRDRALRRVSATRTSTTLAALAQTHATLGETEAAVAAAREAIELSLHLSNDGSALVDPSSARISAEVLHRCGDTRYVYEALGRAPMTESLSVTFAAIAAALGELEAAKNALAQYDSPMVASFLGYLHARSEDFQQAVHYLRQAVNEEPSDADSLLNLSISLWNLGLVQKATRAALRATRTAPDRKDIAVHYLQLLLASKDVDGLTREIASLRARKVVPDAKLLEIQARTRILKGEKAKAVTLLARAAEEAKREGDQLTEGKTRGNLVMLRYGLRRLDRDQASEQLIRLMSEFPDNEAVAVNFAAIARTRREATALRNALTRLENNTTAASLSRPSLIRRAYFRHQLAVLEGDNDAAGAAAGEWFDLEPNNPMAAAAAIVAIGLGQERWGEAVVVAEHALQHLPRHPAVVNNSAYVLAMSGRAEEAIRLLEPIAEDDFVLNATLGMAYLAHGDIDRGMQLYRTAADRAEQVEPTMRSLMTTYQALIVRQLGLDKTLPPKMIAALSLVPLDLPDDWRDRPDFLRLHAICIKNGYDWPLSL